MASSSNLFPREHGAYAEVGFPVLTGLVIGGFTLASVAFATATIVAFLAHEPVAVLRGTRGRRLQQELAVHARTRATILTALTIVAGVTAMALAPAAARIAALIPSGCALAVLPLALKDRVKTIGGELVVAAAFASVTVPIALAGGASTDVAIIAAIAWYSVFTLATFTVHAIKARIKPDSPQRWTIIVGPLAAVGVFAGGIALATHPSVAPFLAAAFLPTPVTVLAITSIKLHPRKLKVVGWSMVAANVVTFVLLVAA